MNSLVAVLLVVLFHMAILVSADRSPAFTGLLDTPKEFFLTVYNGGNMSEYLNAFIFESCYAQATFAVILGSGILLAFTGKYFLRFFIGFVATLASCIVGIIFQGPFYSIISSFVSSPTILNFLLCLYFAFLIIGGIYICFAFINFCYCAALVGFGFTIAKYLFVLLRNLGFAVQIIGEHHLIYEFIVIAITLCLGLVFSDIVLAIATSFIGAFLIVISYSHLLSRQMFLSFYEQLVVITPQREPTHLTYGILAICSIAIIACIFQLQVLLPHSEEDEYVERIERVERSQACHVVQMTQVSQVGVIVVV